ncbi:hypothetical protein RQM47_03870 [Rubrivirga sp. S365]|uniref:hypothetical protein n=1 Tax=Rubrivirga sp. S365 TaxID=3076080 RepID=UPI0028C7EE62|nr:hypothetical protein [Rubrivirga sp. S365]MDT7855772.1 hypothetical protein [Rubrivirga sp. S365]
MPRRLLVVLALLAPLALAACDASGPDPVGITGTWEGVIKDMNDPSVEYPVTFRLTDTGTRVTGSGEYALPAERVEFTVVDGSFFQSTATLDLRFALPPFTGTVVATLTETDPGRLQGTFSGRGGGNGVLDIELVARRVS